MSNIQPWTVDASHIKDISSGSPISILHRTNSIDEFLNDTTKNFISATKGVGKTFLLKIKSNIIRNHTAGALYIPKVDLVDMIGAAKVADINETVFGQFNSLTVHEQLWHYSFILTIIRNSQELIDDIRDKNIDYPDGLLLQKADYPTVKDIYGRLLSDYGLFKDIRDGNFFESFEISLRNFNTPSYIFIDNVDQFYGDKDGVYYEELWYSAQIALLKSVVKLTDDYKHLHIYGTIRKKALDSYRQSANDMYAQLMDSVVKLTYTKDDLKEIFIKNIQAEKSNRLYSTSKDILETNPIKAFVGFDEMDNIFISGDRREELFAYIYRHTLGRPRDLMRVGGEISLIAREQRTLELIRATINKMALSNGQQYLSEVNRFMQISLIDDVYERVEKNILSYRELKNICCQANGKYQEQCENCDATHIFCTLYSYGLLGYEHRNNANKKCTQSFVIAGKQPSYNINNLLPQSPRYFIHPCLSEVIDKYRKDLKNKSFVPDQNTIVGYDEPLKCTVEYKFPEMIQVSNGLEIAKYPVTLQEYMSYRHIKEGTFIHDKEWGSNRETPITGVTYQDAVDYCSWLSDEMGDIYRLPTESEWEECCSIDSGRVSVSSWHQENSDDTARQVGTKDSDTNGIYDMLGNVWEWCSDAYEDDTHSNHRILKGGSYREPLTTLSCTTRGSFDANNSALDIGFRVVKERVMSV